MAWKSLYGREQQFQLLRNGSSLKALMPNSRVFDPEIGYLELRLNMEKEDHTIATSDEGGYLGIWRQGEMIYIVVNQPGPSQAFGIRMKRDGGSRVISSADALAKDDEYKIPPEIKKLVV